MGSKAHHYGVSSLAKAVSRRMLECVMKTLPTRSHLKRSRVRTVEGEVMYEPSRFAQQNLQDAYACLIPVIRRSLRQTPSLPPAQRGVERNVS
jgi:hypothetical protein